MTTPDPREALREAAQDVVNRFDRVMTQPEGVWELDDEAAIETLRALAQAAPPPEHGWSQNPDECPCLIHHPENEALTHAPGCDVFRIAESWEPYGEPRHCDCGFALWDAKRRGVYNWTPPEAAPPSGLDVERLYTILFHMPMGMTLRKRAVHIAAEYAALSTTPDPVEYPECPRCGSTTLLHKTGCTYRAPVPTPDPVEGERCRYCHHPEHGGEDFPCSMCTCRGRDRA